MELPPDPEPPVPRFPRKEVDLRYRKLTANDDYSFGNGQLDFYRDVPEAVGQASKTRLLLWLGEWYLDTTEGTPYLQGVLGKYSQLQADTTIQQRVLGTTDGQGTQAVTDISKYVSTLDPDVRELDIALAIDTIYGPTAIQIGNYANY